MHGGKHEDNVNELDGSLTNWETTLGVISNTGALLFMCTLSMPTIGSEEKNNDFDLEVH